jgi:hypothetical protein
LVLRQLSADFTNAEEIINQIPALGRQRDQRWSSM